MMCEATMAAKDVVENARIHGNCVVSADELIRKIDGQSYLALAIPRTAEALVDVVVGGAEYAPLEPRTEDDMHTLIVKKKCGVCHGHCAVKGESLPVKCPVCGGTGYVETVISDVVSFVQTKARFDDRVLVDSK